MFKAFFDENRLQIIFDLYPKPIYNICSGGSRLMIIIVVIFAIVVINIYFVVVVVSIIAHY